MLNREVGLPPSVGVWRGCMDLVKLFVVFLAWSSLIGGEPLSYITELDRGKRVRLKAISRAC